MSKIDEIMKAATYSVLAEIAYINQPSSLRAGVCERKGAALRHAIVAALAAKDAEIERLKAQPAEPAKPDPVEWIEWKGGEVAPVSDDVLVTIKCRDGDVQHDHIPSNVDWDHSSITDYWGDIVAYRVQA